MYKWGVSTTFHGKNAGHAPHAVTILILQRQVSPAGLLGINGGVVPGIPGNTYKLCQGKKGCWMATWADRDELLRRHREMVGPIPSAPSLDMEILHRRSWPGYEEWKIEYTVETAETMPVPQGQKVPAYLLIPHEGA
jgi:hypothetical protein